MHYAMKRITGQMWVPLPGLVYDLRALQPGEYLLYEASGKLTKDECQGAEVTEGTLPPRTFKYDRRVEVSEGGTYRTL